MFDIDSFLMFYETPCTCRSSLLCEYADLHSILDHCDEMDLCVMSRSLPAIVSDVEAFFGESDVMSRSLSAMVCDVEVFFGESDVKVFICYSV